MDTRRDVSLPKWAIGAAIAVALVPACLLTSAVGRYGVDLPYYDEWGMSGIIARSLENRLTFQDIYAQYTGHRLVFPKLILLSAARATGWNTKVELAINLFLGFGIALLFASRALSFALEHRARSCLLLVPVFSLLSLSLAQSENWMWGWQVQIFLVVLASASALSLLSAPHLGLFNFGLAAFLSVVATFSFANGLLIWPLGLAALLYPGSRTHRPPFALVATWLVVAVAVFIAYFYGFKIPPEAESAFTRDRPFIGFAIYLLAYLGAPFESEVVWVAATIGALGLVTAIIAAGWLIVVRPIPPAYYLFGGLVCLFGIGSGVLTAFGRAGFGANQALSSRYVTISNLFWIGLILVLAASFYSTSNLDSGYRRATRWGRAFLLVLLSLIAVATIRANVAGLESMRQFSHLEQVLRYKLLQGHRDETMRLLAPDLKWLDLWVEMAQRHRLWAWRPGAPPEMFEPPPASYEGM